MLLVCLLALCCLVEISLAKPHKSQRHHREYDDDEDLEPYYRKDKHTSEHVVYHKDEEPSHVYHHHKEHHEPKRVDHFHHYDKQQALKTEHIHYQQHNPQPLRTTEILAPAALQLVTRRRRPSRVLYAAAPNSVFHTQINVQSQDSELNSQVRPDPVIVGAQLPVNGGQLPAAALPNCQFPVAGNPPIGCRALDPAGGQLGANAFPAGGQLTANAFPAGANLGNGNGNNFFIDPSLGAQLGAGQGANNGNQNGQGFGNQNLFNPAAGGQLPAQAPVLQRPTAVLIQFDPALGAQLPTAAQAPGAPIFGGQLGANQAPAGQQPLAPNPNAFGAQLPAFAQVPAVPNQNQLDPTFGGQLPASGQVPTAAQRLNAGRRNGRQRVRSNYQGLNVVNGNVFGQPQLQGPTNAVGNQQDTNIIDGNFYSYPGHHSKLVRVNGNRRAVLLADGDYVDDYDTDAIPADIGFAASSPELAYAVPERRSSRKLRASKENSGLDHETAASEHHENGYLYKNPRRTK